MWGLVVGTTLIDSLAKSTLHGGAVDRIRGPTAISPIPEVLRRHSVHAVTIEALEAKAKEPRDRGELEWDAQAEVFRPRADVVVRGRACFGRDGRAWPAASATIPRPQMQTEFCA